MSSTLRLACSLWEEKNSAASRHRCIQRYRDNSYSHLCQVQICRSVCEDRLSRSRRVHRCADNRVDYYLFSLLGELVSCPRNTRYFLWRLPDQLAVFSRRSEPDWR